jgi:hypothetical protein
MVRPGGAAALVNTDDTIITTAANGRMHREMIDSVRELKPWLDKAKREEELPAFIVWNW